MDADEARDTSRALRQKTSICIEPFQTPSLDLSEEKQSRILQLDAHLRTGEAGQGHSMVLGQEILKRLRNRST